MKNQIDTELQVLDVIAEMVMKFGQLHIQNIREEDCKQLHKVRECFEKVVHNNGYRMNNDRKLKNHLIKR